MFGFAGKRITQEVGTQISGLQIACVPGTTRLRRIIRCLLFFALQLYRFWQKKNQSRMPDVGAVRFMRLERAEMCERDSNETCPSECNMCGNKTRCENDNEVGLQMVLI